MLLLLLLLLMVVVSIASITQVNSKHGGTRNVAAR